MQVNQYNRAIQLQSANNTGIKFTGTQKLPGLRHFKNGEKKKGIIYMSIYTTMSALCWLSLWPLLKGKETLGTLLLCTGVTGAIATAFISALDGHKTQSKK